MKYLICVLFIALNAGAELQDGVYSELSQFVGKNGETLPSAYIKGLPEVIESLTQASEKKILAQTQCKNQIEVTYINSLTNSNIDLINQFESGFVKIDSSFCFPSVDTEQLLKKSNDPVFRKSAFSTISQVYLKDGLNCETTNAPTIGSSNYCYQLLSNFSPTYSTIQSYNVWNDPSQKFDSPVYFRSVFESARQVGQNTQYHLVTYVRANKLNTVQKFFARSFISNTQSEVMMKLLEELK